MNNALRQMPEGVPDRQRTRFLENIVGASLARQPKNNVFRIFRRNITAFFALRRRILLGQNPRATKGRPYGYFIDTLKGLGNSQSFFFTQPLAPWYNCKKFLRWTYAL